MSPSTSTPAPPPGGRPEDGAAVAARFQLEPVGVRPSLGAYLSQIWARRHFAWTLASSRVTASTEEDLLGAFWNVLRPLLTAGVYFVVFGYILDTSRGIENFVAFLTIGVFAFTYTAQATTTGARSVAKNLNLVRALHFPRAVLPLSTTLVELIAMRTTLVVMVGIALVSGEPLAWSWLLLVPALALQTVFNLGLALVLARLVTQVRDVAQLLPFATRMWLYVSGVFFSLDRFAGNPVVAGILYVNPANIYISLYRGAVMEEIAITPLTWLLAVGWAVVLLVGGILFFWRGEGTYGRG